MKVQLIEIDGDFVRADMICAIVAEPDSDEDASDEDFLLRVYLIGREDSLDWPFDTRIQADQAQAKAVRDWLAAT